MTDQLAKLRETFGIDERLRTAEKKYDPSQPREPAGSPSGGQWVGGTSMGARWVESFSANDFASLSPDMTLKDAQQVVRDVSKKLQAAGFDRDATMLHPEYHAAKRIEALWLARNEAAEAAAASLDDFESTLTPTSRARAIEALNAKIRINGVFQTRKQYIRDRVAQGAVVSTNSEGRVLQSPDGSYMRQRDITKFALDYAEYLIQQRKQR